jgi:hypothetical protein
VDGVEPGLLGPATGWAKGTSFEFAGDRITVAIPTEEPRTGTYTISSVREGRIALAVKRADGTMDQLDLAFDDEHNLRWKLPQGAALLMHRVN